MTGTLPSIQRRLFKRLAIALPMVLLLVSGLTLVPIYQSVNADDDEFLQELGDLILTYTAEQANDPDKLHHFLKKNHLDEDIHFILWDKNKQVVMAHSDKNFAFQATENVFINTENPLSSTAWRVWYVDDKSNGNHLAIGQPWAERLTAILYILKEQIVLLLLVMPVMFILLFWILRKGLQPVRALTQTIYQRRPADLTPINHPTPKELQPLVQALNTLLQQVNELLEKEQRFIADASHELRSPLTAIKVQTELLTLTPHSDNQATHLQAIERVTDRATHLIEQLLTLARLDPRQHLQNSQSIDWLSVSNNALQSVNLTAREKNIRLKRHITAGTPETILPLNGEATLLTLLLRNLLDNAVRYSFDGNDDTDKNNINNTVELTLASDHISVRDHGKGINPEHLNRVRERFFRPAGQAEIGSGLGLSIVERIAELHGLTFSLDNHPDGGVVAICRTINNIK